jgi:hypothetical protein
MMNLHIKINIDGLPDGHPIAEDNVLQVYPGIDLDNLPPNFAKFIRVPPPRCTIYQRVTGPVYALNDEGAYTDVYTIEEISASERVALQDLIKASWIEINGHKSWRFNEATCMYEPPTPQPAVIPPTSTATGTVYIWDEPTLSWVPEEIPMLENTPQAPQ